MTTLNLNPTTFRLVSVFSLALFLLIACCFPVYAAPADTEATADVPSTKWVDLQAYVPADFKGSVSVLLQSDETSELYTVTSYPINDYLNSIQLPVGKYTVMQVFTSEDSFLYDAFLETESFDLQSSIQLDVTVSHNPEGAAFLNDLEAQAKTGPHQEDTVESTAEPAPEAPTTDISVTHEPSDNTSSTTDSTAIDTEAEDEISTTTDETEASPSAENAEQESVLFRFIKSALSFLCAVLIFAVVFFGVYLLYHRANE